MVEISTAPGSTGNTGQHDQTASRNAAIAAQQAQQARENARLAQESQIQSGGQGRVGGPYGVQFVNYNKNPSSESQGRPNVNDRFEQQTGSQSKDFNVKANEYASALTTNVGLAKPDVTDPNAVGYNAKDPFNIAFENYLKANNLERKSSDQGRRSLFLNINEGVGVGDQISGQVKPSGSSAVFSSKTDKQPFDTFFSGVESRGVSINIYNAQGAKVGNVKADSKGKQVLENLGDQNGVYFKEAGSKSAFDSGKQREFADFISSQAKSGTVIDLFSGNKKVGQVSGSNAYRDVIPFQTKYGSIKANADYSTSPEGRSILDVVSKGATVIFTKPNERSVFPANDRGSSVGLIYPGDKNAKSTLNDISNKNQDGFSYQVFYPKEGQKLLSDIQKNPKEYENKPQSFWDEAYKSGKLQGNDVYQINQIFHAYDRQQNKQNLVQNKQASDYISGINAREDPSYYFNIRDSSRKVVKTTTGQRAFYDFERTNLDTKGGVSIDTHFSNTPQASGERLSSSGKLSKAPDVNNTETIETFAAITGAGPQPTKASGGLAALSRNTESFFTGLGASLESAFVNQYSRNEVKGKPLESAKGFLFGSGNQFARDITHTIAPLSLTSLITQGKIESRDVKLTPEAANLQNRTSSPSLLGYAMGKEPVSENQMFYTMSGILTGVGLLEGARMLRPGIPIRSTEIKLPYESGTNPTRVYSIGYEGRNAMVFGGRSGISFFKGMPKEENLNLSNLATTKARYGFESSSGKPIQNRVITDVVVPFLEKQGRISKTGALDIIETGKEGSNLAVKAPTIQFRGFGEKPFVNLTPKETEVLKDFLKSKKLTVTGSTAEIPFTKDGLVAQARDIDIKGVPKQKAEKFAQEIGNNLNQITSGERSFLIEGTTISLRTGNAGLEKVLEFPQSKTLDEGYGLSPEEQGYVFGNKTPTGTNKVEGIPTVEYNYQGLRKIASSTELHIEQPTDLFPLGKGEIAVRAATGREVKDPAHVFSFLKTKASNYLSSGQKQKGQRLNIIAENYRTRHPELDFEGEFTGKTSGTLELQVSKPQSILNSIGSVQPSSIGRVGSTSISFGESRSILSSKSLFSSNITSKSASTNISNQSKSINSKSSSKSVSSDISRSGSSQSSILGSLINTSKSSSKSNKPNMSKTASKSSNLGSLSKSINSIFSSSGTSSIFGNSNSNILGSSNGPPSSLAGVSSGSPSSAGNPSLSITQPIKFPIINLGNIGIRRKNKVKQGPTGLINLNVNNIFASSLSINVGRGQRYEF